VLIVDDTESILFLLQRFLRDHVDSISVARNGVEAVRMVRQAEATDEPFDLVLMDLQMPRLSGCRDDRRWIRATGV
jgi:CheY-like chemotaxis protein